MKNKGWSHLRGWITLLCCAVMTLFAGSAQAEEGERVDSTARSAVLIERETGKVLLSCNSREKLPMASTTKIMTALVALEYGKLDEIVTVGRNAYGVPGTSIYLNLGEKITLRDLLYGLMLASGNDAAVAIAEHIGGDVETFCRMMTKRAEELGCSDTVFLTPHGLPKDGHYTTAHDLAIIAREAMNHELFREIVSTKRASISWEGRSYQRILNNKNRLLTDYDGATGIKTGYTKAAGRCLVFGAKRNGLELIGVVLRCGDWFDEAARLMDETFARFESVTMMQQGDAIASIPVKGSNTESVSVVMSDDLSGVIRQGAVPSVEISIPETLKAPVRRGDIIGTAYMIAGGEVVSSCDIISETDAPGNEPLPRWQQIWHNWLLIHSKRPENMSPGASLCG